MKPQGCAGEITYTEQAVPRPDAPWQELNTATVQSWKKERGDFR